MPSDLLTFRITLLLYVGVLLIPFGFFYTYSNVQESAPDISTIRKLGQVGTEMLIFTDKGFAKNNKQPIRKINSNLKEIELWINANSKSEFYVGGKTLEADFNTIKQCWQRLNKNPQKENALQCLKAVDSLSFTIDKMHTLKQKKIKNIFYTNIICTIIFLLLLIYFIRLYIQIQMEKHAIYDKDTHLFNRKYFLARLHTALERAKREVSPLSLFFLYVDNFANEAYNEEKQKHLIQHISHILGIVTRESDTVCRYDDNHFAVLMSHTSKEDALNLEKRMQKALQEYDFKLVPTPEFSLKITEFEHSETEENFIERSKN